MLKKMKKSIQKQITRRIMKEKNEAEGFGEPQLEDQKESDLVNHL